MLVFAGLVKKCLQYGHSFRLAGVWLKCKNLRFACAVDRFCSSRAKNKHVRHFWFSIIPVISGRHSLIHFFLLLNASVPERFCQRSSHRLQQGDVMTPYPAVSPSVSFFGTLAGFSCGAWTLVSMFWSVSMYHPFVEYQQQWFYGQKRQHVP